MYTTLVMANNAAKVANAFLELAAQDGKSLTNMQLQKLVYIAHGFYLALSSQPLVDEDVKAWQWGPVIESLYESLKHYGSGTVTSRLPAPGDVLDETAKMVIQYVWKAYGRFTGFQLSGITHKENSPWHEAWESLRYQSIPNEMIAEYYRRLLNEQRQTAQATQPA